MRSYSGGTAGSGSLAIQYSIVAATSEAIIPLTAGQEQRGAVDRGQYSYYSITLPRFSQGTVQVSLTTFSGDADLYASGTYLCDDDSASVPRTCQGYPRTSPVVRYPNSTSSGFDPGLSSTHWSGTDTIIWPPTGFQLPSYIPATKPAILYIAVKGYRSSSFSILASTDPTVELQDGVPLNSQLQAGSWDPHPTLAHPRFFKFEVPASSAVVNIGVQCLAARC